MIHFTYKNSRRIAKSFTLTALSVLSINAATSLAAINGNEPTIPPEFLPPNAPNVGLARGETTITINVKDSSQYEQGYIVQEKNSSNQWQTIQSSGPLNSWQSINVEKTGLNPDIQYCYRAGAFNAMGTKYSPTKCAYTTDGNDYPVWRVQLEIETADMFGAGTTDDVWVNLNSSSSNYLPNGNLTVLDYSGEDFQRGALQAYDLNLKGIGSMDDISFISINKAGYDSWCIKSVTLKVNNIDVYARDYSNTNFGCRMLDSGWGFSNLYFNHANLRGQSSWDAYDGDIAMSLLGTFGIKETELEGRFEGMVGHMMYYNDLKWGYIDGDAVEVTNGCNGSADCNKIHVNLDLEADANILDLGTVTPEVDIDFDVEFICEGDSLSIQTTNFDVVADQELIWEVLSLGFLDWVDGEVEDAIRAAWTAVSQTVTGIPECEASVTPEGDVYLLIAE